jgi:hypothetical protein
MALSVERQRFLSLPDELEIELAPKSEQRLGKVKAEPTRRSHVSDRTVERVRRQLRQGMSGVDIMRKNKIDAGTLEAIRDED